MKCCIWCGDPFKSMRSQKTCSRECSRNRSLERARIYASRIEAKQKRRLQQASPRFKEKQREYWSRQEVRERIRHRYRSCPEIRKKLQAYSSRPEVRERKRERDRQYSKRQEARKKRQERNARPETREKNQARDRSRSRRKRATNILSPLLIANLEG